MHTLNSTLGNNPRRYLSFAEEAQVYLRVFEFPIARHINESTISWILRMYNTFRREALHRNLTDPDLAQRFISALDTEVFPSLNGSEEFDSTERLHAYKRDSAIC